MHENVANVIYRKLTPLQRKKIIPKKVFKKKTPRGRDRKLVKDKIIMSVVG